MHRRIIVTLQLGLRNSHVWQADDEAIPIRTQRENLDYAHFLFGEETVIV